MNTGLQLRSTITRAGELILSLAAEPVPVPGTDEILVRVEASPINPSDLGLLIGPADIGQAKVTGSGPDTVLTAPVSEAAVTALAARIDIAMPVGNEGAGTVIAAGSDPAAQALIGRTVAMIGGAMYAQYRCVKAADCLVLPDGASAEAGASCFVNPLTALGMVETMRREGHKALVHTAAASNLGQMLNRICQKDGVDLVNIVRSADQESLLRGMGAKYVCDSTKPDFMAVLTQALTATGATLAFDAIGGGKLAGQILTAMEAAVNASAKTYNRYGSNIHKQVYIYGGLDIGPTLLNRNFGMAWGVGGWLLFPFLNKIGAADTQKLRQRVVDELTTTFASHYSRRISLVEALSLEAVTAYAKRATGEKFLILPNRTD
jgi:NADPH:quinone reductase-like Zn-dependent oxidoreductase